MQKLLKADPVFSLSRFNAVLENALSSSAPPLGDIMRYAVLEGGKRFRPRIIASSCALFDIAAEAAEQVGAAVELLHAASLVLDDLPAMDDADVRRDRPSVHRRFGQAQAILAATALISKAFELLGDPKVSPIVELRLGLLVRCAQAIGANGIAGGQALDLNGEHGAIHKTADLIAFCYEVGPILAGRGDDLRTLLGDYGRALGYAFQARDDILDGQAADFAEHVSHGRQLTVRLTREHGYSAERVAPMIALLDWAHTRAH